MAFDFDGAFKAALQAGLSAAKPGGKMAEDWIRQSAQANKKSLKAIALGMAAGTISKETGAMLLEDNRIALEAEAAALKAIIRATAQAAVNAFLGSLTNAISAALKLPV